VVVGDANYDSPIESRLRALDSNERIRWLGHVDDPARLDQLWAGAGIYVHGHSVGGTNPALLQALGAGAPTLAFDTPFNEEVLGGDEQLYPADAGILANRIREVLNDDSLRSEWSRRGQERIAEQYNWPDISEQYLAALREAAERRGEPQ
jgi:glycosyltransferase involved in cell wall biosynthesis